MNGRWKRVCSLCLSAILTLSCFTMWGTESKAEDGKGTDYYIDSDGGNDDNSGTSPEQAWSSLEKVNDTVFQPGDRLLFQRGDVWTGQLSPQGSGEKGNPIIIAAYGEDEARPLIQGNNWCGEDGDDLENRIFNAAVYFYNQQYWELTSLEITNRIPGDNPDDHIKKYGVLIMGEDAGTLEHMYCRDLYVHDVVSHPIGQQAGIGRGGIIYSIRGNEVPTNWNDIIVEDNQVGPNINHYGINFMSTWGSSRFQHETGIPDEEYAGERYDSTNLIVRNNYCEDIGNAAICPTAYSNALIEYNTVNGCNSGPNGNVPIWWENGNYTVAQFNEVFGSGASETKEDSQAFDADVNATENYIQYNYTHDNPSGAYFECALGSLYTTYIRYNISQNDGYGTNSYGGGAVVTIGGYSSDQRNKMYVYNNDFYLSQGHNSWITNNWDGQDVNAENFLFTNNAIYSDAASKGWHKNLQGTAYNNAYGGSDKKIIRTDDENALSITKEDFKGIGTAGIGRDTIDGYLLSDGSACKGTGVVIPGNGGLDYWGNKVSATDIPNIGCDNSGAVVNIPDGALDFEDRPDGENALTGEYQGNVFGEGWYTKGGENKSLLLEDGRDTGSIQLNGNKALKSFRAKCSDIAWVTVTAGGYKKSFCLTSANNTFDTGFTSAADEITFTINSPSGNASVEFDDLIFEGAEKERTNLALNKPAEASGVSQYPASYGNDGNEGSMWVHAGDEKNQWWSVDLGKEYNLSDFELLFEKDEPEGAWQYQIEGRKDNQEDYETLPIYDAAENTDGSMLQTGTFEPDSTYRYLRIKITGFPGEDFWPGFAEFRVFEREEAELTYQVAYDVNGGTPESIDRKEGLSWESTGLLPEDPSREGYTFKGWTYGDKTVDNDISYGALVGDKTTASIVLKAQWEVNTHTVQFQFAEGRIPAGAAAPESQAVRYGEKASVPELKVPAGWKFKGWFEDKSCTRKYDFAKPVTFDLHLYGTWEKVKPGTSGDENPDITENQKPGAGSDTTKHPEVVKTGDNTMILLWFSLLGVTAAGAAGIIVYKKRVRTSDSE